jgi:vacuolar-type H+-ATPase catalytic subunit A/Vma1
VAPVKGVPVLASLIVPLTVCCANVFSGIIKPIQVIITTNNNFLQRGIVLNLRIYEKFWLDIKGVKEAK